MAEIEFYYDGMGERVMKRIRYSNEDVTWTHYVRDAQGNVLSVYEREEPGRNYTSHTYRYGFNGMEKDDEMKGEGNSVNFTFRMHDPRLGRFLSVDPLAAEYPWNAPYTHSENRVIDGGDLEGLEYKSKIINFYRTRIASCSRTTSAKVSRSTVTMFPGKRTYTKEVTRWKEIHVFDSRENPDLVVYGTDPFGIEAKTIRYPGESSPDYWRKSIGYIPVNTKSVVEVGPEIRTTEDARGAIISRDPSVSITIKDRRGNTVKSYDVDDEIPQGGISISVGQDIVITPVLSEEEKRGLEAGNKPNTRDLTDPFFIRNRVMEKQTYTVKYRQTFIFRHKVGEERKFQTVDGVRYGM